MDAGVDSRANLFALNDSTGIGTFGTRDFGHSGLARVLEVDQSSFLR